MPTLETPPSTSPTTGVPPPPRPERPSVKVNVGRFGELDHSELVHLLDSLDDERSKARFRESIYISMFFWTAVVLFLIFAPRVFPHTPQFVTPGNPKGKITNLTVPPEVQKAINHAPRFKTAPKSGGPGRTFEQPQQSTPQPPAPQVAQQPAQVQAPQAAPPPPPPVVQQSPLQQPQPPQNVAALPSAPTPSTTPTRPNFGNPNTSARDMVQQAGKAARGGGGLTSSGGGSLIERHGLGDGVDILSDTQGVDFDPYIAKIKRMIEETWWPLIPEEARPPLNKQGETQIRFIILPDGRIGGMLLEGSTHDDAINKSCWGSITGVGQFPPLPKDFHGPNLDLRFHYYVNKEPK